MKLSVIIPSYKFKSYIKECVDSVLRQRMNFDFEVIIRDDGTNDGTYEYLSSLYSGIATVKILDSTTNLGAANNLITLLKATNGEFVAHLDGDDVLCDDEHYQRSVDFLEKNPEYSMVSGGYKYMENGEFKPTDGWLCGGKRVVELEDLLVENYISVARVFRRFTVSDNLFSGVTYPDWTMNFEILKRGMSFCFGDNLVAYYRIHAGGMFAAGSEEEKRNKNEVAKKELARRYALFKTKVITIVDSFVSNESVRDKLDSALDWMAEDNHEVLLVSNTAVEQSLIKKTKFYLYDSRNQLFKNKYDNVSVVDFWKGTKDFGIHDIIFNLQKHGLSVLINLFNCLSYAKNQGYTHFQRFEVDDLYGKVSRKWIAGVPERCAEMGKRGLFYYNENHNPPDASFHYYYCEINYFLSKIKKITCEEDYVDYLREYYGNKEFKIVEAFIYDNLTKNGDDDLWIRTGEQMQREDFTDTAWNTETSISNFEAKYADCPTKLYKIKSITGDDPPVPTYAIFTYSYKNGQTSRRIVVETPSGDVLQLVHTVNIKDEWAWNALPVGCKSISVYEGDKFLYREHVDDCMSYVNFLN